VFGAGHAADAKGPGSESWSSHPDLFDRTDPRAVGKMDGIGQVEQRRSKAGCREEISNLSPRRSGPCSPWQSRLSLHHGEVRRSVFRCPSRMWPARKWNRKGYSGCGQATACQPTEMVHWTRTMIARAFDPKPGDIPLIFWDRIKSWDAVSAKAWPTRVQTKRVARPVRPTNH